MKNDQRVTWNTRSRTNFESAKNSEHILRGFTTTVVEHILLVDDDEDVPTGINAFETRRRTWSKETAHFPLCWSNDFNVVLSLASVTAKAVKKPPS